uniref:Secreted protein n=1 Tax=Anopheles farauti TaxID=69004 RepID=A0A182QN09_9DIPT
MIRSYFLLAVLASGCFHLLLLQPAAADHQRASAIGKASHRGAAHSREDASGRVRAQLAGGFIDDAPAHRSVTTAQRDRQAAGSGRKAPVRGTSDPVHTYIKTDKNANFKWGVRHFVGKNPPARYGGPLPRPAKRFLPAPGPLPIYGSKRVRERVQGNAGQCVNGCRRFWPAIRPTVDRKPV